MSLVSHVRSSSSPGLLAAKSTAPKAVLQRIVGPIDEALARAVIGHPKAVEPGPGDSTPTPVE